MRLILLPEARIADLLAGESATGSLLPPCAVSLGAFDGLHLGHQSLVRAVHAARERHGLAATALFTFRHHPRAVVAPASAPRLLTTWREKLGLLAGLGVDAVVAADFCPVLAQTPYDVFVQRFLLDLLGMRHFVVGHDVHLGAGRGGNEVTLAALARRLGFGFEAIPPLAVGGRLVSSSAIRNLLAGGDVAGARALLGRPYGVWGEVGTGDGRGVTIGFPTANLQPLEPFKLLPAPGVYAVRVLVPADAGGSGGGAPLVREALPDVGEDGALRDAGARPWRVFGGMLNFGRKPTFHSDGSLDLGLEVHLFDFAGQLRGRLIKVEWLQRLRDERKFAGARELIAQLRRDEERARAIVAAETAGG